MSSPLDGNLPENATGALCEADPDVEDPTWCAYHHTPHSLPPYPDAPVNPHTNAPWEAP